MQEVQRLESLGVLAGGIAHDFNNVLTVILGNTRLAASDLAAGLSPRERLARIEAAAEHAAALTGQMLTYSGKASIAPSSIDLSRLARDMLDLLRASVSEKCRLDVDLEGGLPPVEGDATQLRQVLLNLVTNASDALGDRGGEVWVRTGCMQADADTLLDAHGVARPEPGEYVYLEVSDTGIGMDEEQQHRVFEPFFTTKETGRGLGLAAVLGIVCAHRGVIRIESAPGAGTIFRVLLPSAARAAHTSAAPDPSLAAGARAASVLVIDDDEAVLELAREVLERAGHRVLTASTARAGIALFRERSAEVDAVVLDLALPGSPALAALRAIRPEVPIVVASGYDRASADSRLGDATPVGFLHKPYEPSELLGLVRAALARRAPPDA
jgi:CheY-like chemotaxis protein